jgi:hypothetical protein
MYGGTDKGPCLLYWNLSYRRKFIRSLWIFVLATAASPLLLLNVPMRAAVLIFEGNVVLGAITLVYTYRKWQSEVRLKNLNPTT